MPQVAVAVVAAAAGQAAVAAAGAAGIGWLATGIGAAVLKAVVGGIVTMAFSAIFKPDKPNIPPLQTAASDRKMMFRSSIIPARMVYGKAKVSGGILFAHGTGAHSEHLHLVVSLAGHRVKSIGDVFINDEVITPEQIDADGNVMTGNFAGVVRVRKYLGTDNQAADPLLMQEAPDLWDATCVGRGIAYLYVRLTYNRDKFGSIPNIAAIVEGKDDIYDPRTDTFGYTNNWALCVADYLCSPDGLGGTYQSVHLPTLAASANISDEAVVINAEGATQARYTLDGAFDIESNTQPRLEEMMTAGAGAIIESVGLLHIHAGAYRTPTDTLTADDIKGSIQVLPRPEGSELFNGVKGVFIDPARQWAANPFGDVTNTIYVAQDNGERVFNDIRLPFTIDNIRAQRIAKIVLERARQSIRVRIKGNLRCLRFSCWDVIGVTEPSLGWDDKPFRIVQMEIDREDGSGSPTINMILQEEAAATYDWNHGAATLIDPAPNTSLPNPLAIPAPTGLLVLTSATLDADGAVLAHVDVSWDQPAGYPFVSGYEVQWRPYVGTEADWTGMMVPPEPRRARVVTGLRLGEAVMIRVRVVSTVGARGQWVTSAAVTQLPDVTPPSPPSNVVLTPGLRQIALRWTNPPEADRSHVEVWENTTTEPLSRYKQGEAASDFFIRSGLLPNETRHFWLRAVDRTGNASAFVGPFSGQASMLIASDIQAGIIDTSKLASNISPVEIWPGPALPTTDLRDGRLVYWSGGDRKLWRYDEGAVAWATVGVSAFDELTGTVSYGQIAAGAVRAAEIAAGEIRATHLAAEELITQSAQIGSGVITSANIANLTVTSANIADLTVGTNKITGDSLTDMASFSSTTAVTPPFNTWTSYGGLSVEAEGDGKFLILTTAWVNNISYTGGYWGGGGEDPTWVTTSESEWVEVRLVRGGVVVGALVSSSAAQFFIDQPSPGVVHYLFEARRMSTTGSPVTGGPATVAGRRIAIVQFKR